jgi:hypothetical protein
MTTQQDILRTMMTQLDESSDKIPEGLYLKFCDHLKNLHTCQPVPVAPRRCGRCHQVGHNRRNCVYYESDKHALDLAYQNRLTPAEAGIERTAVYRSKHPGGCPWRGGRTVVEVDLPGVESAREITWNAFGGYHGVQIKVPGKYKVEISLLVSIVEVVRSIWNPRTQTLTYTLQTVDRPPCNPFEDLTVDDGERHFNIVDGSVVYDKLVKSSNTLNVCVI